jgi:hypothetical protein
MKINPIRQKVYKCINSVDGKLESFNGLIRLTSYNIHYIPNQIVKPAIGKIMAFGNLDAAKLFVSKSQTDPNVQIWEAEGYGNAILETVLPAGYFAEVTDHRIEKFWRGLVEFTKAPELTIGCASLKLIKQIV